jgi:ribosomal protein L5
MFNNLSSAHQSVFRSIPSLARFIRNFSLLKFVVSINVRENQRDKSGMDNPETQTTLITRHRTKTNKAKCTTQ